MTGVRLVDQRKIIPLCAAVPSSFTSLWLDLQWFSHCSFVINVQNAGSGTGSAITVNQATTILGGSSKALVYNNYFSGVGLFAAQTAAADVMTNTTGVSGTFTTATTASALLLYVIEVHETDLDLNNNFKCVQLAIATGASETISAVAYLTPRFGANFAALQTALT